MNGVLVVHVSSSRLLYGKSFTPRLGLPAEPTAADAEAEDDAAGALPSLDAPAAASAAAKPAAAAAAPAKKPDDTLEMMSLAMIITGLYAVAQNSTTPASAAAAPPSASDRDSDSKHAVSAGVELADPIASFDSADNLIRFRRDAACDVLLLVFARPSFGARHTERVTDLIFAAFRSQFKDQLSPPQLTQTRSGLKFGSFDRTLKSIASDYVTTLINDSFYLRTNEPQPAAPAAAGDNKNNCSRPAWVYVSYSPVFAATLDSGLSSHTPIATPVASNGAAASQPVPTPVRSSVWCGCCGATPQYAFRAAAAASASLVVADAAPAGGLFVVSASDDSFPPDFSLVSEQSVPVLMRLIQTSGKALSQPSAVRDTVRSIELSVRLPKSQSAVAPAKPIKPDMVRRNGDDDSSSGGRGLTYDYHLYVFRRADLVIAFPIRVSAAIPTSGAIAAAAAVAPAPNPIQLASVHDDITRLHAYLEFIYAAFGPTAGASAISASSSPRAAAVVAVPSISPSAFVSADVKSPL